MFSSPFCPSAPTPIRPKPTRLEDLSQLLVGRSAAEHVGAMAHARREEILGVVVEDDPVSWSFADFFLLRYWKRTCICHCFVDFVFISFVYLLVFVGCLS